jgi:RNA ligase
MTDTYIFDLINGAEFFMMMQEDRINKQVHPNLPISIYNYTAKAQFLNKWTTAERICRGLIVEDNTGKIIARGPEKFFNYGQSQAPEVTPDTLVTVTRKEDGSLGIGWTYDGHYGVATRGSFASPQAIHATGKLTEVNKAHIAHSAENDTTMIWEIVYPENRIVLDYKERDELIHLGEVLNNRGIIGFRANVMVKDQFLVRFEDALKLPIPDDQEGYVLDIHEDKHVMGANGYLEHHVKTIGHVKLKGETYKILHGLLTNTNARRIWAQLAWRACHNLLPDEPKVWAFRLGNDPEDFKRVDVTKTIEETFLEKVPDEFYDWVTRQIDSIEDNVYSLTGQAKVLIDKIAPITDKRERWEMVKDHPLCTEILRAKDSEDLAGVTVLSWKLSRPGDETPFKTKEDV